MLAVQALPEMQVTHMRVLVVVVQQDQLVQDRMADPDSQEMVGKGALVVVGLMAVHLRQGQVTIQAVETLVVRELVEPAVEPAVQTVRLITLEMGQ